MEPWSSRYLTRRSRTTLGEMSDATRRKNSQEVSRLEVAVRHMDRELHVKAGELSHEQLVLQRSLTARPSPARGKSLTLSAANFESLKRKEKDNMAALDDKCRNFIRGREGDGGGENQGEDAATPPADARGQHYLPTSGAHSSASSEQEGSSGTGGGGGRGSTSPQTEGGDGGSSGAAAGRGGVAPPRERRYGVAHATDVHLDIDVTSDQQEGKNGYSPLRRTNLQQHKFRRTNSTNVTSYGNQQPLTPRRASKRETPEVSTKYHNEAAKEGDTSSSTTTPEEANAQSRRKSLPVVMGRQMRRHDRSSKSRESLLLPNLGQGRSPSPMADLRVKVTYADGEEQSSVTDVPFRPHLVRSQRSLHDVSTSSTNSGSGGQLSSRGPRLEIDLSIPMGSPSSRNSPTSSPRHARSARGSRREKTYTV